MVILATVACYGAATGAPHTRKNQEHHDLPRILGFLPG